MLPSVSHNVDVGTNISWALNTCRASNTGRRSDVIVLIEAGGFYSRKYGKWQRCPSCHPTNSVKALSKFQSKFTKVGWLVNN